MYTRVNKHQSEKKIKVSKYIKKEVKKPSKNIKKHIERNKNTNHINHKIFYLLRDPFVYVNAYTKISKNKDVDTRNRLDNHSLVCFGFKEAKILAEKVSKETYVFSPAKRASNLKQGKNNKRFINVSIQLDKIVQEVLRDILEAIYGPVFKEFGEKTGDLANNYGFRPKSSAWTAMDKIRKYSKRCNLVLEGSIVSSYNSVNHGVLISILKKRIKDSKFLNLINSLLKSGVMDTTYRLSLDRAHQGEIVSSLLFNIYMLEFDKYVYKEVIQPMISKNEKNSSNELLMKEYNKKRYRADCALKLLRKEKSKNKPDSSRFKSLLKSFKQARQERNKTKHTDSFKLIKGCVYVRYLDSWVLCLTSRFHDMEYIKTKLVLFLKDHLKMELDKKKTKISLISNGYKFLGFEIRLNNDTLRQKMVLTRSKGIYYRGLRRITPRLLTIEPDSFELLKRLKLLNMYREHDNMPLGKPQWRIYNEFEIVKKYAQIFHGIFNYYYPCKRLSRLSHISYILQYSCAKTLAGKLKISLRSVFEKFGKNLKVKISVRGTKTTKVRTVEFLGLTALRNKNRISNICTAEKEIF